MAVGGYVSSGLLLCVGSALHFGAVIRAPLLIAAVIAFLAGAVVHILDKLTRLRATLVAKINDSIGDVYDEGERAGVRHEQLAAATAAGTPQLAAVHDLSPR